MNFNYNITSNFQMFFHQAGSCQMEGITALYNYIMSFLVGILCVVTTALILIILIHLHGQRHIKQYKFEKNLDVMINWLHFTQRWTHSTVLELIWTVIPTLILIAIAVPSFILLYSLDEIVDTQTIVKITAFQWYWKYEYPVINTQTNDIFNFSYLSYMLPLEDLTKEENLRLLEVDMPIVVPTNVNIKLIITAKDVIHSFAVPALGVKMDAVPGRLNQVTLHIFKPGIYYGQCSELCGVNHAFMPIALHAIDFNTFENFLTNAVELITGNSTSSSSTEDSTASTTEIINADTPSEPKDDDDKDSKTDSDTLVSADENLSEELAELAESEESEESEELAESEESEELPKSKGLSQNELLMWKGILGSRGYLDADKDLTFILLREDVLKNQQKETLDLLGNRDLTPELLDRDQNMCRSLEKLMEEYDHPNNRSKIRKMHKTFENTCAFQPYEVVEYLKIREELSQLYNLEFTVGLNEVQQKRKEDLLFKLITIELKQSKVCAFLRDCDPKNKCIFS